jgi:hypothetical protein
MWVEEKNNYEQNRFKKAAFSAPLYFNFTILRKFFLLHFPSSG